MNIVVALITEGKAAIYSDSCWVLSLLFLKLLQFSFCFIENEVFDTDNESDFEDCTQYNCSKNSYRMKAKNAEEYKNSSVIFSG